MTHRDTFKIKRRHSRASLLVLSLSLVGIFAPYIVVRAASLMNTLGWSDNYNTQAFYEPSGAPNDVNYAQLKMKATSNIIVCTVTLELNPISATSGALYVDFVAGGNVYSSSYVAVTSLTPGIYTPTTFSTDPCFTVAQGDNYYIITHALNSFGNTSFSASPSSTHPQLDERDVILDNLLVSNPTIVSTTNTVPLMAVNGVDAGANPNPADYGLVGTSTNPGDFGFFGNYFLAAMQWLFLPSQAQWQSFTSSSQASLATKIPFGWFAQVSSTFAGLQDEDTTTTVFMIYASSTTSTYSVVFFDPQQIKATIPENVRTLIRLLGGLALWAAFFFWLWTLATRNAEAV